MILSITKSTHWNIAHNILKPNKIYSHPLASQGSLHGHSMVYHAILGTNPPFSKSLKSWLLGPCTQSENFCPRNFLNIFQVVLNTMKEFSILPHFIQLQLLQRFLGTPRSQCQTPLIATVSLTISSQIQPIKDLIIYTTSSLVSSN